MKSAFLFSLVCMTIISVLGHPSGETKRLIKTSEADAGLLLNEAEILLLKQKGIGFIDITDRSYPKQGAIPTHAVKEIPTSLQFQTLVNNVISQVNLERTEAFVRTFSSYFTRYYGTPEGEESAFWLLSELQNTIANSPFSGVATAASFAHTWRQPSIIARIEGSDPILRDEIVILGAHLDSMNLNNPQTGAAPGADDNASGSAVLLETFRLLLESDFVPKRTIEFQWYAAEEIGLRGSGEVAEAYSASGVNVHAMVNFDIVGYFAGREEIGIVTDFTNADLTAFLRLVIDEYLEFTWTDRPCGYGCSDHASFDSYGFRASFPVEIVFHPDMHTPSDTIDSVNFNQVREFIKLAVAYSIELTEIFS